MAIEQRDIRLVHRNGPRADGRFGAAEQPMGDLFRELAQDATRLIQQEIALGKAELRETAKGLGRDAGSLGMASALGALGGLAAMAFAIIGFGDLIGSYWLSALIISVVLLGVAWILANRALDDIRSRQLKPEQTMATVQGDLQWAKREVTDVKRQWRS